MPTPSTTDAVRERTWSIAQVADEFGVTHRTVRHYEELGLITPERRGTTRVYHRRDLDAALAELTEFERRCRADLDRLARG